MRRRIACAWFSILCLVAALGASSARGQAVYGGIIGTVTDPPGGGIVGATVTGTSIDKSTSQEATTNESGNYTVTHLIPGNYKVRIEGKGFKGYDITSVQVSADNDTHADAQLTVGDVT